MRKDYTEEEILELGRKALAKHKITVYVLQYTFKHGETISVYGGSKGAQDAAKDLMSNRISSAWDRYEVQAIEGKATFDDQLAYFNEVEAGVSYGDHIVIHECVVGA